MGHSQPPGHRTQAPVRAIGRRLIQGTADDLGDPLIVDRARSPGTRFVVEAVEPMLGKPPTPLADRVRVGEHLLHNRLVLQPIGRRQHDPRPPRQALGRLAPTSQTVQLTPLRGRQGDRYRRSAHRSFPQHIP